MSRDVFVVGPLRTAIGKYGGSLLEKTAVDLGVAVVEGVISRARIESDAVDHLIFGNARQAGGGPNPARQVSYRAGIPRERTAYTINMACASGMKSIALGAERIQGGRAEMVICGGMESMSRLPYYVDGARFGMKMGNQKLVDAMYRDGFLCPLSKMIMGETAEKLAQMYKISRDEQDRYALESQSRAAAARDRMADEVLPVFVADKKKGSRPFATDEHTKPDATLGDLAKLAPVFNKEGSVTAGNASGITDGAAAMLLASADAVSRHGLKPIARIVDYEEVGVDPEIMGIGPVPATRALLTRQGISLDSIGLVELNEAFAAQVLACLRELPIDRERLNVNGGAIALGHPIGCTGARIVVTLLHEMARRKTDRALATLCVSGGLGMSMLFERV
ncbi:MAG: thiolase family protein [Acidobacteria bacterium]|nr:thiolase family protein [Acidobacteriota bacterium]